MATRAHPPEEGTPAARPGGRFSTWLSWGLIAAGAIWIAVLLVRHGGEILAQMDAQRGAWLALSVLLGAVSMIPTAFIFQAFVSAHAGVEVPWLYAARLFYVGHVVRHTPGRFWGLVYQVNAARAVLSPGIVVRANVDMSFLAVAFNLVVPLTIMAWYRIGTGLALGVLLLGVGIAVVALHTDWIGWGLSWCRRWLPARIGDRLERVASPGSVAWADAARAASWLALSWLLYLVAWEVFGRVVPGLADTPMPLACAAYAVAWVVGFVSMVTPAGLGVREMVFLSLSAPLAPAASLAALAVIVRVWLLLVDLLLFLPFLLFRIAEGDRRG